MKKYFLGVDNGGTMTKAALFDETGKQLASAGNDTPLMIDRDVYNYRDMSLLWEITARTIKECLEAAGVAGEEVACVGCTGHGKGLYLWGRDGKPAYDGIASSDHRAYDYIRRWEEDGTMQKAKKLTLQRALEFQPVALLAWIKDHEPEVYQNIRWVFEAKDYIRFCLTGEAFAEYTDYSGSSLMNLHTKDFDPEILALYGIGEMYEALPPLKYSYENCGYITPTAAGLTGLAVGTPVCGGMFDIDACAIAMDVSSPEKLCVITGTWSINEFISKTPVSPDGTTINSLFCMPDYYLIEESSPASAGNLDWFIKKIILPHRDGLSKKEVYREIDARVEALPPEESRVFFLPFLYGTNVRGLDEAAFLGLNSSHDETHMLRAIFEGVAYCHKMHIDRLLLHREKPSAIRLAGGAGNSRVWMQIFADVLGLPIEVVDCRELGALGCAMAAAVCCGSYRDYQEAAASMVTVKGTIYPQEDRHQIYSNKYQTYKKYAEALASVEP